MCCAIPHNIRWWNIQVQVRIHARGPGTSWLITEETFREWIVRLRNAKGDCERMLFVTGPLNTLSPTLC